MIDEYQSWGRYPKVRQKIVRMNWRHEQLPISGMDANSFLPFGNGRSYGDVCLNDGGVLIDTRQLDRFVQFDSAQGILRCESGVFLSKILELTVPKGWFLSVTPGSKLVTVGGAIANDVHGKNHHRSGTFGCHVIAFELLRSDGQRLTCSLTENPSLFKATIGGLGLTGLITWVEIQLAPISNTLLDQESIKYSDVDMFFELAAESDERFEHTVAWVDCRAKGKQLGRGIFHRANFRNEKSTMNTQTGKMSPAVPAFPRVSLVNHVTSSILNTIYYRKHLRRIKVRTLNYDQFFYPLDSIRNWNRMYGPSGFLQYQCVIPHKDGAEAVKEILNRILGARACCSLAVMKIFGNHRSPGLLSFPRPGVTLALDFPNKGTETLLLLDRLDEVTASAGGAVYPAKDARLSAASFELYFPDWEAFVPHLDPRFCSSFWRRVRQIKS